MERPKLRDSKNLHSFELYPLNELPNDLIVKNGNLIGKNIKTGLVQFTWQPHGLQFTIHTLVPQNAVKFQIKQPPVITKDEILKIVCFDYSWVKIIK